MSRLKSFFSKKFFRLKELKDPKEQFRQQSYSQSGEDLIVTSLLIDILKIKNPSYIDIGCHHPYYLSNTALLYQMGSRGVCIEPDPGLFTEIQKHRPEDVCLQCGIGLDGNSEKLADFYLMTSPTLNTFSKEEAERFAEAGTQKIEKMIKVPLIPFNELVEKYCKKVPDFVSLDTEGFDYNILSSIDFSKYRPPVFCVETLEYVEDRIAKKITKIIDLMLSKGYVIYADTRVNTIFVDSARWRSG